MNENDSLNPAELSRARFIQYCGLGILALATGSLASCLSSKKAVSAGFKGPANRNIPLDDKWLFGGRMKPGSLNPGYNDATFSPVTIPHSVTQLSWQDWKPGDWQDVWIYRKRFTIPGELKHLRYFLHFDGVMVVAKLAINGHALEPHLGGYLPFEYEITSFLIDGENLLALAVDCNWSNVPPEGAAMGPKRIDYLEMGGIHRAVYIKAVPQIFIKDVFVKPVNVLDVSRRIDVQCTINAATVTSSSVNLVVEMKEGERVISSSQKTISIQKEGDTEANLSIIGVSNVTLWDIDNPHLYTFKTTLYVDGKPLHDHHTRTGLRDARFTLDGFFLNGRRLQLFGLNRHEIYPYVGFAMPDRVKRRDAYILRKEFNCNIVRCSHYPQSPAFLDACDELGLLVWEEIPGFQYLGDESWSKLMLRDVKDMIIRDRNRPSVIIWGTRANESQNAPALYQQSKALAKQLDDSRPSSGSMAPWSRKNWKQEWDEDVFAYDDYHSDPDGSVGLEPPIEGYPYFFAEAVGQFNYSDGKSFDSIYRRGADLKMQSLQAIRHAQAHSKAAANPRIAGLIAWCAFEYASLINPYKNVKYPGVADIFRIPKLGASFYRTQKDPQTEALILPNFYWDFGEASPNGPGKDSFIFSNCDRLELFVNDNLHSKLFPDSLHFPHLQHPPFMADLEFINPPAYPELRIEGYLGEKKVISRSFSSDPKQDQFLLAVDDKQLVADGSDATRIVFHVADKYGAPRALGIGEVAFKITGPGTIIGDNPFNLSEAGGAAAVWIKTLPGTLGTIYLKATHSFLGEKKIEISVDRNL